MQELIFYNLPMTLLSIVHAAKCLGPPYDHEPDQKMHIRHIESGQKMHIMHIEPGQKMHIRHYVKDDTIEERCLSKLLTDCISC